jgi:hypothetical protein
MQNSLASMDFADCTFPAGAESMRKTWDQDIIYCQALDLDSDVLEVGHNETRRTELGWDHLRGRMAAPTSQDFASNDV